MGIGRIKNNYNKLSSIIDGSVTKIYKSDFGNVIYIKPFKFYQSLELLSVELPHDIGYIGQAAFMNCQKLNSINLEDTKITSMNPQTFNACLLLTSIKFPNTMTQTGTFSSTSYAPFSGCRGLQTIDVNSECVTIRANSFYIGATSVLTGIYIRATTPPSLLDVNAFASTNDCPIYVPRDSLATYQSATNWSSSTNNIVTRLTAYDF